MIFFKHVNLQFCVQSAEQEYIGFLFYYLTVNVHVSSKILSSKTVLLLVVLHAVLFQKVF